MSRACRPMCESPMSPSISAFGTSAATESMTTTSTAPERTRISQISSACSPVSGCEIEQALDIDAELLRVLHVERVLRVDERGDAPAFCAFATTCRQSVVLPLDSGP